MSADIPKLVIELLRLGRHFSAVANFGPFLWVIAKPDRSPQPPLVVDRGFVELQAIPLKLADLGLKGKVSIPAETFATSAGKLHVRYQAEWQNEDHQQFIRERGRAESVNIERVMDTRSPRAWPEWRRFVKAYSKLCAALPRKWAACARCGEHFASLWYFDELGTDQNGAPIARLQVELAVLQRRFSQLAALKIALSRRQELATLDRCFGNLERRIKKRFLRVPDGPHPPNQFVWRGNIAVLTPNDWKLVKILWEANGQRKSEEELGKIWGIRSGPRALPSAITRVNNKFARLGIPITLARNSRHVLMDRPKK